METKELSQFSDDELKIEYNKVCTLSGDLAYRIKIMRQDLEKMHEAMQKINQENWARKQPKEGEVIQ